jgi:PAS domain S-box-containing protein
MEKGNYYLPETDLFGQKTEEELQSHQGVKTTSGAAADITEHGNAEDFLKAGNEKFRQLIANSFDMLVLIDPNGIQQFVSESCEKILGYRPDELINIPVIENMIHPDDQGKIIEIFRNSIINGSGGAQYRHRHKNGGWVYLEAFGTNQFNNPCINSIVLNVRDISERKSAEEALRESEEKHRILLDDSSDPIFTFYPDGQYRYVNKAFADGVGRKTEEIIGRKIWDVFPKDEADKRFAAVKWVFENGEEKILEVRVPRPDGDRWYLTTVKPIMNENGTVITVICISKEITTRKQGEVALRESEARMRELNATKDKFFSIIAHDLRNPFNSIIGFSDLLTKQVQEKDYEGIVNYSQIILNSSQRAMDLLMNLMDWSRMQTGRIEFVSECIDMVELTNEVLKLLNSSSRQKSIAVNTEFPPLAFALADKAMISTVLRNLISNAVKFTHPGGEIVISAKPKQKEWVISVSDNGVGIKKEAIGKLFRIDESYSTLGTQNEKGTGLGLLLCKEFVEKHNGKIWVESEEGKGSKFHFSVPKG